jgi:hypothetical protein
VERLIAELLEESREEDVVAVRRGTVGLSGRIGEGRVFGLS